MNSSIIKKLSVLTLVALGLLAFGGGGAWWQFDRVVANQNEMSIATGALRNQMEAAMMHNALRADVLATLHAVAGKDQAAGEAVRKTLAEHVRYFHAQIAENHELKLSPKATTAINEIADPLNHYIQRAEALVATAFEDAAAAEAQLPQFFKTFAALEARMSAVSDAIEASQQEAAAANQGLVAEFHKRLLITGAIGVLVLIFLTLVIGRSIPGPFRHIIRELAVTGTALNTTSATVVSASQDLAAGASQAAASLEETSASLEEITSMIKRTAANAQTAKQLGNDTRAAADAGATDVQAMSRAMVEIKASSDNIAKIIKAIDEIAFQTNLLALNAAVEAARAGEAGAGFAVVADEVRSLAQRSAQAAKEIAAKIEDSIQKSQRGVQISEQVNTSLAEIVSRARQMNELINEIAAATAEQNQGITQINSAIFQLDHVTQGGAASSSTIASAAEELRAQAHRLDSGIAGFTLLVGEEKGQSQPAPEAVPTASVAPAPAARFNKSARHHPARAAAGLPRPDPHAPATAFKDF